MSTSIGATTDSMLNGPSRRSPSLFRASVDTARTPRSRMDNEAVTTADTVLSGSSAESCYGSVRLGTLRPKPIYGFVWL
ncbi:hypothetical protein ElyMa_004975300 [Elysia marginata]|uniref:Uncharacterized protein n=1 Tax=Elysia marginata TaxID=1093978 RepID=A0AAV4J357_9GAST|nr:hypothetical protein ElyMa_004975300 [Elysia marginata]